MVGLGHFFNKGSGNQPSVRQLDTGDLAGANQSSCGLGIDGQDFGRLSGGDVIIS